MVGTDAAGKEKETTGATTFNARNPYTKGAVQEEVVEEDPILTQLKQTQANISLWSLLTSSYPHKLKLEDALARTMVSVDSTPDEVCQMIGTAQYGNIITFTELDLPPFGPNHNESLHISISMGKQRMPHVLVDNGSAMNVLPAKMMSLLGIDPITLKPSNMTIKAYDSTSRAVLGVATLDLWFGGKEMAVEFQVIDIPVTFTALLGRPWLHKMGAVASTLHQCVKFVQDGTLTIMYGDSVTVEGTDDDTLPVMEIKLDDPNLMLSGFRIEQPKAQICTIDLTVSSDNIPPAMRMMRHMSYIPGLGLGKKLQGLHKIIEVETRRNRDGLGYVITPEDKEYDKAEALKARMAAAAGKVYVKPEMRPYSLSLNKYFVRGDEMYVCPEMRLKQMNERAERIRQIVTSQDPIKEMLISGPRGPGVVTTFEHEYHFQGGEDTVNRFARLTVEDEPVIAKIRNANPVEVDESLANLFGSMELSVGAEGDKPMEAEPLIVLAGNSEVSEEVAVKDPFNLIDFGAEKNVIAFVRF